LTEKKRRKEARRIANIEKNMKDRAIGAEPMSKRPTNVEIQKHKEHAKEIRKKDRDREEPVNKRARESNALTELDEKMAHAVEVTKRREARAIAAEKRYSEQLVEAQAPVTNLRLSDMSLDEQEPDPPIPTEQDTYSDPKPVLRLRGGAPTRRGTSSASSSNQPFDLTEEDSLPVAIPIPDTDDMVALLDSTPIPVNRMV